MREGFRILHRAYQAAMSCAQGYGVKVLGVPFLSTGAASGSVPLRRLIHTALAT